MIFSKNFLIYLSELKASLKMEHNTHYFAGLWDYSLASKG